ncbi:MAG: hypothetical protein K0R83_53, partial [Caulobacter sp.]|nr:hypothetical protein [Caulobacter sp.]
MQTKRYLWAAGAAATALLTAGGAMAQATPIEAGPAEETVPAEEPAAEDPAPEETPPPPEPPAAPPTISEAIGAGKLIFESRARYETVDQDGLANTA